MILNQGRFRFPGGEDRTCCLGMTGTGKTVLASFLLLKQRWNERPWVAIDFKDEILFDKIGQPPMQELRIGTMPNKKGLYRMRVSPRDNNALEDWLWRIWERENVGLYCDEFALLGQDNEPMKAILRQGRSKRIPVIAATQRPVDCDREIFTESTFMGVFKLKDVRDYKIVEGMTGTEREQYLRHPLAEHNFYWYDAKANSLLTMPPVPPPDVVAKRFKDTVPFQAGFMSGLFK